MPIANGAELESRYVEAGGVRAHVRVSERAGGVPVVLVHGLVISSLYMVPTARCLAPHVPVYAPDLPGFGLSGKPRRVLSVPEHAAWLAAWAAEMGIARAAWVGNSFGCQVIAHLAAERPELVAAAVLAGPTMDRHARTAPRQIGRWLVDWTRERPSLAPAHVRDYWKAGVPRALETFRLALRDRIENQLPRMPAATLVVRGSRDTIVPEGWARAVAALLPAGRYAEVPGGPHCVNYTTPGPLTRLVLDFLAGAARSDSETAGRTPS
jgi:pimeloyl-ACP methyl ester carboxylesterase